jgi:hypothetical protein
MNLFSKRGMGRGWLCAGALALGLSTLAPGAAVAATSYSVLQINLCNSGFASCYTGRAVKGASDLIVARRPSMVTANEICAVDLAPIRDRTGYVSVFTQSGSQNCKNGSRYGNAMFFPSGTNVGTPHQVTYSAQDGTTELRTLTCAPAGGITSCATHLSAGGAKADQGAQMKGIVGAAAGQGPTALGGDWNMAFGGNPNAQDYVPANMFRKGDGEVQHVIASSAHFSFVRTQVMQLDWTDHPGLQVYLTR